MLSVLKELAALLLLLPEVGLRVEDVVDNAMELCNRAMDSSTNRF